MSTTRAAQAAMGRSAVRSDDSPPPLGPRPDARAPTELDAIGTDELRHVLTLRNSGQRNVWQIISQDTTLQAPALPSEYDADVSFPFPGAPGTAIVQSITRLEMD